MRAQSKFAMVGLFCVILAMSISSVSAAGSFDLLLQDHWVYDDLALLADTNLLEQYDSAQDLAAVFPLARYEVAMLVGDLLAEEDQSTTLDTSFLSADLLMLRILESQANGKAVKLSGETVAQARDNSEAALKAVKRLVGEFAQELEILGMTHGPRLMTMGAGDKNGLVLRGELGLRVAPLGPTIWQTYHTPQVRDDQTMAISRQPRSTSSFTLDTSEAKVDTYRPVELSALLEQLDVYDDRIEDIYPTDGSVGGVEVADGSLKLQPSMAEKRPVGLLSSYFTDLDVK